MVEVICKTGFLTAEALEPLIIALTVIAMAATLYMALLSYRVWRAAGEEGTLHIVIQFLPYGLDHSNPPVIQEPDWNSPQTRQLAERACFDCHSNETEWPWYSNIFPMSVMVQNDVEKGRKILNFSEWSVEGRKQAETEEMVETISKEVMPLPYYLILHPEAQFTDEEKGRLINGLIESLEERDDSLEAEDIESEEDTE